MKILITSGGTKVPLDSVRDITNMSSGTFGSKIATEAMNQDHEVLYVISKDGRTPFCFKHNFLRNGHHQTQVDKFDAHRIWSMSKYKLYQERTYRSFDEYAAMLQYNIEEHKPDIIILAAAVSDYIAEPSEGKMKSSEDLTIQLKPAEKIISKVKEWSPKSYLVGFKLLVGASNDQLIEASQKSINDNGCDLVVANELNALKSGNHHVILVSPKNDPKVITEEMASEIVKYSVEERTKCTTS